MFAGNKGFTILEVVLGASIFLIGMLGIAGLQISAINAEAFSARVTEGTMLARSTFEELMTLDYSDERLDDDDGSGVDGGIPNFDLDDDMGPTLGRNIDDNTNNVPDAAEDADEQHPDNPSPLTDNASGGLGTNDIFRVSWSVCEDCLIDDTKTVRVIVFWRLKGDFQSVDFYGVIPRK